MPGAPELIRALAAAPDAVRVSWTAPAQRGGRLTHYSLYTRELGKYALARAPTPRPRHALMAPRARRASGEWAQRVDAGDDADEAWHEVRGLRERAAYEFWVRAHTTAGAGAPSRAVSAAPHAPGESRQLMLNKYFLERYQS